MRKLRDKITDSIGWLFLEISYLMEKQIDKSKYKNMEFLRAWEEMEKVWPYKVGAFFYRLSTWFYSFSD